jgi:hypothetical protein
VTDKDGEPDGRWERRERFPVDVFGQDRSENSFVWLVGSNHFGPLYLDGLGGLAVSRFTPKADVRGYGRNVR